MMYRPFALILAAALLVAGFATSARGQIDQAKPGETTGAKADPHAGLGGTGDSTVALNTARYAAQNRTAFERDIQLDAFRLLSIQHLDHVKIIDSWARQSVRTIYHRESIGGKDPVYLAIDMALRPEAWMDKNIFYIESVPIREELGMFAPGATPAEKVKEARRIREEARVSLSFLIQPAVSDRLQELARDSRQVDAVNKVYAAMSAFIDLGQSLAFLPPPPSVRNAPWVNPADVMAAERKRIMGDSPTTAPAMMPAAPVVELPPYTAEQRLKITLAFKKLVSGWDDNDVQLANQGLAEFVVMAMSIDPEAYPSLAKRTTELWYNRSFSGTLVAFIYFTAMVLFFLVAVGVTKRVEKTALGVFGFALACHITAMGVRWWLNGRIPIQNQFESVMGSACLGCTIGFALEAWKKNGIFGAAFGFVGFLATTSMLAAPYVFGKDLGAAPGNVAGILNTYWLYIHVNIVIASYALISASAAIAGIYLIMRQWYWVNPLEPGFEDTLHDGSGGEGPRGGERAAVAAASPALVEVNRVTAERTRLLDTLDQANMVVLQMVFWFLGIGIMCGAVWADQSWGRPWGWDPKETFALVTWIVYLVIVHVRLVIKHKADTTAWLAVAGFGVMLFNYIGVNYFLKGLHSYA